MLNETSESVCNAKSFKEYYLQCEERTIEYIDYIIASLMVIISTIVISTIIIIMCYIILYIIPKTIGHKYIERNKNWKTDYDFYPFDYEWSQFWPFEWKKTLSGYLIIFIIVSIIITIVVGLYWFGHLLI